MSDYEIDQVRQIRHQVSEENDHDLRKIADYYRRVEDELKESGRFKFADDEEIAARASGTKVG